MITLLRSINFYSFIALTNIVPMDPPTKKEEIIQWDTPQLQKALARNCFQYWPKELMFPFLIMLPPQEKDDLRKTCKAFSSLLSLKNIQPFMFCSQLNASEQTIKRIFIEAVCNNDTVKRDGLYLHSHVQSFGDINPINYIMLGSFSSVGVALDSNTIFLNYRNSIENIESIGITAILSHPLTQETLSLLENSSKENFDFYICAAIKQNDHYTAELIRNNKKIRIKTLSFNQDIYNLDYIYKLIQLGLYCCSNNFMPWLTLLYQKKMMSYQIKNRDIESMCGIDYLTKDFQKEGSSLLLHQAVYNNITKLNKIHWNQKEKLHDCLAYLFRDNLKYFDLTKDEIAATIRRHKKNQINKKDSNKKDSNKNNCVIQ